jgi:hypothetical protein
VREAIRHCLGVEVVEAPWTKKKVTTVEDCCPLLRLVAPPAVE